MFKAWRASRLAWTWSERAYAGSKGKHLGLKRHLRWAVQTMLHQGEMLPWLQWLEAPEHRVFAEANPRLVFRPLGLYVCTRWGVGQRIRALCHSYGFLNAQGGRFRDAMLKEEGVELVRLPVGKGTEAVIRLGFHSQFRKEGEFAVFFHLGGIEGAISSFAFTLDRDPREGWVMYVGAVQGRKGGGEEEVKVATKALHGLRPKQLMGLLAQEIARALRVQHIRGIANDMQVFRSGRIRTLLQGRKVVFDYDGLWAEMEGVRRPDGWFEVPLRTPRREPDEIKPNKRSMYAKRYAFLDDLTRQLRTMLTPFGTS